MTRNDSGEYASVALEAAAWDDPFAVVVYDFIAQGWWQDAAEWLVEEAKKHGHAEFRATPEEALAVAKHLPKAYRMDHDGNTHHVLREGGEPS